MKQEIAEKEICKNCESFIQHYVQARGKLLAVDCGHCIQKHMRRKSIVRDQIACGHFVFRKTETEKKPRNELFRDAVLKMVKQLNEMMLVLSLDDTP